MVVRSLARGVAWALGSPALVLWLWLVNLLVALPAAVVVGDSLRDAIGPSRLAEELDGPLDLVWLEEFRSSARGLESTLAPSALSPAAPFDNLEAAWSGELFLGEPGLVAVGGAYLLLWVLMSGGILRHFVEGRPVFRVARLLEEGGRFFFRFLRLAALSGALYYGIFRLSRVVFSRVEGMTRDLTVEKTAFLYHLAAALAIAFLLAVVRMSFDYAKIATVVEGRRSMLVAALRGLGFVVAHPLRTLALFSILGLAGIVLAILYYLAAPGLAASGWWPLAAALGVGQLYLLARLTLRLAFYGGQLALFERLAGHRRSPPGFSGVR